MLGLACDTGLLYYRNLVTLQGFISRDIMLAFAQAVSGLLASTQAYLFNLSIIVKFVEEPEKASFPAESLKVASPFYLFLIRLLCRAILCFLLRVCAYWKAVISLCSLCSLSMFLFIMSSLFKKPIFLFSLYLGFKP
jgi:hypothetical protein